MTTLSHESSPKPTRLPSIVTPDMWPSLAIAVVWIAVLVDAVWGPNIETSNGAGTNTSSTPSAVALALFAFLTSWVVARYAYRRTPKE